MRILFILLLLRVSAVAQTDFFDTYYPAVDRAESAFVREEFREAIGHYTEAFEAVDEPLARDLYNAVVCYYLIGDIDGAKPWLLKLARKGIDPAVLRSQEAFQVSNIQAEWESFEPIYRQISDLFVPQKDLATDRLIEQIQSQMGAIRNLHDSLPDIYFEMDSTTVLGTDDSLAIVQIEAQMKVRYEAISTLAAEHILANGFPTEEKYGVVSEDLNADALRSFLANVRFYALLQEKQDPVVEALQNKLWEEVGKGSVHRDYIIDLIAPGQLSFVRVQVPIELDCHDKNGSVFIHPRTDRSMDALLGHTEEGQITKGHYSLFRNKYFLMNEAATYQDRIIASCSEFMDINQTLIPVEIQR